MEKGINNKPKKKLSPWLNGVVQALPIVLGYVPVGFAYGVLAQKAGLSMLMTLLMSVIVFAGSAQLIAVGLFSAGMDPLSIILTTFVINLRHMLFSAALSPKMQSWKKLSLAGFAFELTDETFALHITRMAEADPPKAETFAVNLTAQVSWILGTWLGIVGGQMIADIEPYALDYALPAMFIALLVMQIKNRRQIFVAILAGGLSVGLYLLGLNQWYVILATVIAATAGVVVEQWTKKQFS